MSDTLTREDRREALDAFAHSSSPDNSQALVEVRRGPPPEAVYGSREVSTRRDEASVLQKIRVLAAAAGTDWYYRYPVRNKGQTNWIEGLSIGGALDVARLYGNCHVDCRAEDFGNVVLFHARFHDVESGFSLTRPFQQRRGASKLGGEDAGRRAEIDFSIGASKAIRNVVVNGLKTYAKFALEEAKDALVEKIGKNLPRWRSDTIDKLKVDLPRVEAVIGRPAASWLAPDVARVRAMGMAIEEGMATWDETFPPLGSLGGSAKEATAEALDQFADERSMVGGAASDVASSSAKADAGERPSSDPASAPRQEIIDKLLRIAAEKGSKQEHLEVLDVTASMLASLYPDPDDAAFVKAAVTNTAKVIGGEMSAGLARQYLEGLIK